ncbi:hypothetical protein AMECASPLE_025011 [Ameca splendens]|uniref:Uncharacterized protein n=1 Tax=Ameca splendens TaxID=208324 RepID=A0ABV0Y4U5_9TELE
MACLVAKMFPKRSAPASPPSQCCCPINFTQKGAKAWKRVANETPKRNTKGEKNTGTPCWRCILTAGKAMNGILEEQGQSRR